MPRKTVLVTGASRGIGKAIAIKFAKKGYNVVITCVRRQEELLKTQLEIEDLKVDSLAWMGDAGDYASCEELFTRIKKQFGGLDVLVNNAGISYIGLLQDMKPEEWDRIVRTNLTSVFNCCRLAIPGMLSKSREKSSIFPLSGETAVLPARLPIPLPRAVSMPLRKLWPRNWLPAISRSTLSPAAPSIRK